MSYIVLYLDVYASLYFIRDNMSGEVTTPDDIDTDNEVDSSYKPPPEKTIEQILQADQDDESLRKYKEALLGEAQTGGVVVGKSYMNHNLKTVVCLYLVMVICHSFVKF